VKSVGQQRLSDVGYVAFKSGSAVLGVAVGNVTGTSGATVLVEALLSAAGASAGAIGPGTIAAIGMGAIAGTIALVMAIRKGKATRKQAIALAQDLGFEGADSIPAFTVRALKKDAINRDALRDSQLNKVSRLKNRAPMSHRLRKARLKLLLLDTIDLAEKAEKRGVVPPPDVEAAEAEYTPWFGPGTQSRTWALYSGAFSLIAGATGLLLFYEP